MFSIQISNAAVSIGCVIASHIVNCVDQRPYLFGFLISLCALYMLWPIAFDLFNISFDTHAHTEKSETPFILTDERLCVRKISNRFKINTPNLRATITNGNSSVSCQKKKSNAAVVVVAIVAIVAAAVAVAVAVAVEFFILTSGERLHSTAQCT